MNNDITIKNGNAIYDTEKRESWEIRLLGTRGSMAVTGDEYKRYGGDTLCVQVTIGEKVIFFDAGTGILHGRAGAENHILIGHPHLDHLIGLSKWTELANQKKKMKIYMAEHGKMNCAEIMHRLYGPPFWPVSLEMISKELKYITITERTFRIGDILVETLPGNHPGGVTHFKLSDGTRSLVYAVDCELTEKAAQELQDFACGCDILICDGQLLEEDVQSKRGWGHSTVTEAARLGEACGARQTVLVHYDPASKDKQLDEISGKILEKYPACVFGKQGEVRFL